MKKQELLNLKKALVSLGMMGMGLTSLTGCESDKASAEVKTETIVTEEATEETIEETVETVNSDIESLVSTTYSNYKEYCDANGITENEIRTMILILNDEYEGLSEDEVEDACRMIEQTYFPDNVQKKIRTLVDVEDTGIEVNLASPVLRCSEMIYKDECKKVVPILETIEQLEAVAVKEMKDNNSFDQIRDGFNNEVVNLYYKNWDVDNGLDFTNVSNESGLFAVAVANQGLINMLTCMNPATEYVSGNEVNPTTNEPYKIKIAWNTAEQEIEDKYTFAFVEGNIPDDIQTAYNEIKGRKVINNFVDDACRYKQATIDNVAQKSNTLEYTN